LSNILPLQRTTTVNGHHNRNNSIQALKKVFALAYMKGKQELRRAEVGAAPAALKIIARQSWLTAGWPHDVPLPRPLCPCDRPIHWSTTTFHLPTPPMPETKTMAGDIAI